MFIYLIGDSISLIKFQSDFGGLISNYTVNIELLPGTHIMMDEEYITTVFSKEIADRLLGDQWKKIECSNCHHVIRIKRGIHLNKKCIHCGEYIFVSKYIPLPRRAYPPEIAKITAIS